jgi:sacsin
VEWNQLLFDIYIPQAWMHLLITLVKIDGLSEIFTAWPPAQGHQNGDAGYWKDLPAALFKCINRFRAPIWPVVPPHSGPCDYLDLGSVRVAAPEKPDLNVLQALAVFGLKITRPPAYIHELLGGISLNLTPKSAHDILLVSSPAQVMLD